MSHSFLELGTLRQAWASQRNPGSKIITQREIYTYTKRVNKEANEESVRKGLSLGGCIVNVTINHARRLHRTCCGHSFRHLGFPEMCHTFSQTERSKIQAVTIYRKNITIISALTKQI